MAIEETSTEDLLDYQRLAQAQRDYQEKVDERKMAHEQRLLEIKIIEQGRAKAKTARVDAVQTVLVSIIKLPVALIFALLAFLLVLAKREVPQFMQDVLSF